MSAEKQVIKHQEKPQQHTITKNDNSLEIKHRVTKYCDLIDREFKIVAMNKPNKLQEGSGKQLNELRNQINEQKENFTKEIGSLKNNQTEILELTNSINEMKNALEISKNRGDHMEETANMGMKIEI